MSQNLPSSAESSQSDIIVDAIYQDGVIKPLAPIALPPDTPLRLRIATRLPATATLPSADDAESGHVASPSGVNGAPQIAALRHAAPASRMQDRLRALVPRMRLSLQWWDRAGLLVLGLILVGLGQSTFLQRLEFSWSGLLYAFGGIVLFSLALTGADLPLTRHDDSDDDLVAARPEDFALKGRWRVVAGVVATLLMLVLLQALQAEPPLPSYNWYFFLWLAAVLLYIGAIAPLRLPPRRDWRAWWSGNAWVVLSMTAILAFALGLRVWQIGSIPPTLSGDEGSQGLEALKILRGEITNPFTTGWLGVPTMSFYFNVPTIALMGNTATALRLPWAFVGTATVLVSFWLVRRLYGVPLALITAALLAVYHYHIHYSRLGSNQIADALFVALALLFLYRGYDRRTLLDWALCGMVIGVSQFFYAGARFTAIVVVATTAVLALRDGARFWREQRLGVVVMLGAALLSAAPMIQYAIRFPDDYNARINMVGIFQSGWIEREQGIRNEGVLPILLDQFKRASLAYTAYPDRTFWYGSPKPLFDFFEGVLFLLGLGYAGLRLLNRRLFPMTAWWLGAIVMGGALTESPPSSQRLITTAVPAIFFVALALLLIGQMVWRLIGGRAARVLVPLLGAVVLALGFQNVRWYFVEYTPTQVYGNFNAVVATGLSKYAHDKLGADTRVYFFGPPRMYYGFGTIPYLAPEVQGIDVNEPLTAPFERNRALNDKDAAFVFLPERRNELDLVRQTFPNGSYEEIPSPLGGDPLFLVYRVPRDALTQ